ncbi:MOSC domain-containing protein [Polycladomyces sp. WAk]|uniref:MOSC domain-containing protein n=1 Tax=Polycladomyces zharkentensis TaxID=2807616 RepID=A0ABS2WL34_9BACL|nr:MOSC domain-containing protein [Polycladomyces sp. WAk]MBN2910235.1 MOSC domain-containing protein [Polycladomyces sp. WAk]
MHPIGEIKEIMRYPVKSFQGESVQRAKVMKYGLYGDRSHAFLDETRPDKFLTISQCPEMVRYQARFLGEESLNDYPPVEITTPDGKVYFWGDTELQHHIERMAGRKVSPVEFPPTHVPFGAIEEEHVQIVTDASLEKLQELWGKEIDVRRFRPNFLFTLYQKVPFVEDNWLGKMLKIGELELMVKRHCERCMIITVDPKDANRDTTLLKTVVKERNNCFGVYATVIKPGEIEVGQQVLLIE